MGYIRKKICSFPGCQNAVIGEGAYCDKHKKEACRDTTSQYARYYKTPWWRKARKNFLLTHLWCEECARKGKHTLADTVHHREGFCNWTSFCDKTKWEALCSSCHGKIHSKETNEDLYRKYHGK